MLKTTKKNIRIFSIFFLLFVIAVIINIINNGLPPVQTFILGLLQTNLYIAVYAIWGISVSRRILQTQVRFFLECIAALLIFWMLLRAMKYYIFIEGDFESRYLWYLFYIPMLCNPLLSFFVSISLGKPDNYKIPKCNVLLPVICMILIYIVVLLVIMICYVVKQRKSKGRLNQNSIKEAVDNLPMALCYFSDSGMVKLCNKQMETLFRYMTNMDLQYYSELKKILNECNEKSRVKRLEDSKDTYLFPDGKAWHYCEKKIQTKDTMTYTEILFTDVTDLYEKGLELKGQVSKLQKLSNELKRLSDNALVIARENEILTAKTRLHDQMGAGIVAVRHFLLNDTKEAEAALYPLRRAIAVIKDEIDEENGDELDEMLHDAKVIGVKIELKLETKRWREAKNVLILAMRECLTNAVRHADATILSCCIKEKDNCIVLHVTNNGSAPKEDIKPKGGLKNLLRIVNNCGGSMKIVSKPYFILSITIPYER